MGFVFLCYFVIVFCGLYGLISIKVINIKYNYLFIVGNNLMEYKLSEVWEVIIYIWFVN